MDCCADNPSPAHPCARGVQAILAITKKAPQCGAFKNQVRATFSSADREFQQAELPVLALPQAPPLLFS